jgi:hypothetical protein
MIEPILTVIGILVIILARFGVAEHMLFIIKLDDDTCMFRIVNKLILTSLSQLFVSVDGNISFNPINSLQFVPETNQNVLVLCVMFTLFVDELYVIEKPESINCNNFAMSVVML